MKSPRVLTPASEAIVAVAMMLIPPVRTPLMIVGTASGSSIRRRTWNPLIPIPRAASTASRSTWRMPTNELVRIGGIPSTASARVTLSSPTPMKAATKAISASSGTARPALPSEIGEHLAAAKVAEDQPRWESDRDCRSEREEGDLQVLAGELEDLVRPTHQRVAGPRYLLV